MDSWGLVFSIDFSMLFQTPRVHMGGDGTNGMHNSTR